MAHFIEKLNKTKVGQRLPGLGSGNQGFEPGFPAQALLNKQGLARHPDSEKRFDDPSLHQGDGPDRKKERAEHRQPKDQRERDDREAASEQNPNSVKASGEKTEKKIQKRSPGPRIGQDGEESPARRPRLVSGRGNGGTKAALELSIGGCDLFGRSVLFDDRLKRLRL
jgi:hypothetical protein